MNQQENDAELTDTDLDEEEEEGDQKKKLLKYEPEADQIPIVVQDVEDHEVCRSFSQGKNCEKTLEQRIEDEKNEIIFKEAELDRNANECGIVANNSGSFSENEIKEVSEYEIEEDEVS